MFTLHQNVLLLAPESAWIKNNFMQFMKSKFFVILRKLKSIIFITFLGALNNTVAGEIHIRTDGSTCYGDMYFSGKIEADDLRKLKLGFSKLKKIAAEDKACGLPKITLNVNSEGGDVEAALALGREIRQNEIRVTLGKGQRCYSACVYLLAAGVDRVIVGQVGVHRLYFADLSSGMSSVQIKQKMDIWDARVLAYLREMNVSAALYQDSQSIAPENLKILNDFDLQRYRLDGEDVVYNEKITKEKSSHYNLTMAEYRKRQMLVDSRCLYSNPTCSYAIMVGVDEEIIRRRLERMLKSCPNISSHNELSSCEKRFLIDGK